MNIEEYQKPTEQFKFNDPRYEVALGESDLDEEAGADAGSGAKQLKSRMSKKAS